MISLLDKTEHKKTFLKDLDQETLYVFKVVEGSYKDQNWAFIVSGRDIHLAKEAKKETCICYSVAENGENLNIILDLNREVELFNAKLILEE